ncbi:hypothetical protein CROQUDRAFT_133786 [Cronartium quercuum f. sp. fusiforme G11]|uniref:Uncharacterized protein n=1 Tax=Cronartium quercuum f. sp. fusiforme G11 TaxID=708437 RepID=A0A9P6NEI5_9BASI|nr:hypothetical protein CROQUDRAFT_133786 [Cronartium quercuum f. sp. fusiforme G11]
MHWELSQWLFISISLGLVYQKACLENTVEDSSIFKRVMQKSAKLHGTLEAHEVGGKSSKYATELDDKSPTLTLPLGVSCRKTNLEDEGNVANVIGNKPGLSMVEGNSDENSAGRFALSSNAQPFSVNIQNQPSQISHTVPIYQEHYPSQVPRHPPPIPGQPLISQDSAYMAHDGSIMITTYPPILHGFPEINQPSFQASSLFWPFGGNRLFNSTPFTPWAHSRQLSMNTDRKKYGRFGRVTHVQEAFKMYGVWCLRERNKRQFGRLYNLPPRLRGLRQEGSHPDQFSKGPFFQEGYSGTTQHFSGTSFSRSSFSLEKYKTLHPCGRQMKVLKLYEKLEPYQQKRFQKIQKALKNWWLRTLPAYKPKFVNSLRIQTKERLITLPDSSGFWDLESVVPLLLPRDMSQDPVEDIGSSNIAWDVPPATYNTISDWSMDPPTFIDGCLTLFSKHHLNDRCKIDWSLANIKKIFGLFPKVNFLGKELKALTKFGILINTNTFGLEVVINLKDELQKRWQLTSLRWFKLEPLLTILYLASAYCANIWSEIALMYDQLEKLHQILHGTLKKERSIHIKQDQRFLNKWLRSEIVHQASFTFDDYILENTNDWNDNMRHWMMRVGEVRITDPGVLLVKYPKDVQTFQLLKWFDKISKELSEEIFMIKNSSDQTESNIIEKWKVSNDKAEAIVDLFKNWLPVAPNREIPGFLFFKSLGEVITSNHVNIGDLNMEVILSLLNEISDQKMNSIN